MFSTSKEGKDPRWAVSPRAASVAYLLLSDSFIEQIPERLKDQIGRQTERIECERKPAIMRLSTFMQDTNCSALATLHRDSARVLAFVESQMFTQDCTDGRMEKESKSILGVIKTLTQTKEATFSTYACLANGMNVLFSCQNVIGSINYTLSGSHNVSHLQSNQFPHGDSFLINLFIPNIDNDLRLAVSKKSPRHTQLSKRPFCQYNEGNLEPIIAREVKRIHR
jgi:hypothetical protein